MSKRVYFPFKWWNSTGFGNIYNFVTTFVLLGVRKSPLWPLDSLGTPSTLNSLPDLWGKTLRIFLCFSPWYFVVSPARSFCAYFSFLPFWPFKMLNLIATNHLCFSHPVEETCALTLTSYCIQCILVYSYTRILIFSYSRILVYPRSPNFGSLLSVEIRALNHPKNVAFLSD